MLRPATSVRRARPRCARIATVAALNPAKLADSLKRYEAERRALLQDQLRAVQRIVDAETAQLKAGDAERRQRLLDTVQAVFKEEWTFFANMVSEIRRDIEDACTPPRPVVDAEAVDIGAERDTK